MATVVFGEDWSIPDKDWFLSQLNAAQDLAPEYTPLELIMQYRDWPGMDSYYGQMVTSINQQFRDGQLLLPDGTPVVPWPDSPNEIAWQDTTAKQITVHAMKTQGPLLVIGLIIAGILVAIGMYTVTHWIVQGNVGSVPSIPGSTTGPSILSTIYAIALVIGIAIVAPPLIRALSPPQGGGQGP